MSSSGLQVTSSLLMISDTTTFCGDLLVATTARHRSRSVMTSTSFFDVSSTTGMTPTFSSRISSAAAWALATVVQTLGFGFVTSLQGMALHHSSNVRPYSCSYSIFMCDSYRPLIYTLVNLR